MKHGALGTPLHLAQALEVGWATLQRAEYMQNNFGLKGKTNLFVFFSIVIWEISHCSGMPELLSGTILPSRWCFFSIPHLTNLSSFLALVGRHRWPGV